MANTLHFWKWSTDAHNMVFIFSTQTSHVADVTGLKREVSSQDCPKTSSTWRECNPKLRCFSPNLQTAPTCRWTFELHLYDSCALGTTQKQVTKHRTGSKNVGGSPQDVTQFRCCCLPSTRSLFSVPSSSVTHTFIIIYLSTDFVAAWIKITARQILY